MAASCETCESRQADNAGHEEQGPAPAVVDPVDREPGRLRGRRCYEHQLPECDHGSSHGADDRESKRRLGRFEPTHEPGRGCGGAPHRNERGDAKRHERGERAEADEDDSAQTRLGEGAVERVGGPETPDEECAHEGDRRPDRCPVALRRQTAGFGSCDDREQDPGEGVDEHGHGCQCA